LLVLTQSFKGARMKVSKNKVTLLGAAIATLFASAASAQIVLPSSLPTVAAVNGLVFARELAPGTQLVGPITVNTVLGIGMSSAQDRYVKITLTNATFNAAVTNASFAVAGINAQIAVGGQATTSSVTFQLTSAAGNNITDAAVFNMASGVNITNTASAATVTYEVYEFLNQANAGTPTLYARTGTIASFTPAIFLAGTTLSTTATAASSYLNVAGGNGFSTATRANISNTALAVTTLASANGACGTAPCLANTTAATVAAIVNTASTANVISVAGNFDAAASAASVATTVATEVASSITAGVATIPLLAGSAAGTTLVRYTVNGTTALPVSTYVTTGTFVPLAGYVLGPLSPTQTATIARDGSQLDSPWVTATPGFISRFFLTQTTPATVPYTVTVRNAAGLVTGGTLTGTLSQNRVTLITLASLLPADTTAVPGPYQVTFNIAANLPSVQGTYALTTPSGAVSNTPLYTLAAQ
jgi:hypothetical protein